MRKLLTFLIALAAVFGITLSAFGQMTSPAANAGSMMLMGVGTTGGGTVSFDAVSSSSVANNAGTTLSWTHTPIGTPTAVAVSFQRFNGTVPGVTYGGNSMTLARDQAFGGSNVDIYGLPNPPAGAQTVVITCGGTANYIQAGAVTVTGSNISTAFDASNSASGSSTAPSVSVTSLTGEFVIDVVGTESSPPSETPGGGQTLRWGPLTVSANVASGSSAPAAAGSTSMLWTLGSSVAWGEVAASFHK
jgi:hypothetical protein